MVSVVVENLSYLVKGSHVGGVRSRFPSLGEIATFDSVSRHGLRRGPYGTLQWSAIDSTAVALKAES